MFRSTALAFVLAASIVSLSACSASQTGGGESTATTTNTTTVAPLTTVVNGRNKVFANALAQVALRADQRATIEQMAKDAEARALPERQARAALSLAIADQVQGGTIDKVALQPKVDAITAAHVSARPAERSAFEKLHDLLMPDQRASFVTAMQANAASHQGARAEGPHGHMQKWATELGLTQPQQDQIRQLLQARRQGQLAGAATGTDEQANAVQGQPGSQPHAMHQQMKSTLEAFKGETFSMDQVAPIQNEKPMAHALGGHMLDVLETALPILTAEQRTLAATKLRQRASNLEADDETN
jgi:Spy/CpxP family protein refolding chaperone